jgi:predicted NUDIX family NTP pyrophosphohydrolase
MYRHCEGQLQVMLVHPGGPFWAKRDAGAWTIPKGEIDEGEEPIDAARREFAEETGFELTGELLELQPIRQAAGKIVLAWAVEGDCDPRAVKSNLFSMEWPPRSGLMREYPEVDLAGWFDLPSARVKILASQAPLLDQLEARVESRRRGA